MDFEQVPCLAVDGYRIAPITLIEPGDNESGDAYLLTPEGQEIDLHWRADEANDSAIWMPSSVVGGLGVIQVRVRQQVASEDDLRCVLELAARVAVACGERPPGSTVTAPATDRPAETAHGPG